MERNLLQEYIKTKWARLLLPALNCDVNNFKMSMTPDTNDRMGLARSEIVEGKLRSRRLVYDKDEAEATSKSTRSNPGMSRQRAPELCNMMAETTSES